MNKYIQKTREKQAKLPLGGKEEKKRPNHPLFKLPPGSVFLATMEADKWHVSLTVGEKVYTATEPSLKYAHERLGKLWYKEHKAAAKKGG